MTTLAEFLKGKVDESLTKLVQPAGVVPAMLFVLLNLAFIYPPLKGEIGFLGAFGDLDTTWQAVVAAALIVFLGYILLSASTTVLDTLAGENWRHSPLYKWLSDRERRSLEVGGKLAWEGVAGTREEINDRWEVRASYPIKSGESAREKVEDVGPTALGNVLHAGGRLIFERHGIDPSALWSQMEAVVPKDADVRAAITDAKASLDTLANLAFVLGVFAIEGALLFSLTSEWTSALLSALVLVPAYAVYRAAVAKARGWGDTMAVVFDLYREELHKQLELRKYTSASDERALWGKVSRLFLWGREHVEAPADDVFKAEPSPAPTPATITSSPNLKLTRHLEEAFDVPGANTDPGARRGRYVGYEFVVTRRAGQRADGFIAVTDKRVVRIVNVPTPTVIPDDIPPPTGEINPPDMSAPSTLLWQLPRLAAGASFWLSFTLPIWEFEATPGLTVDQATRRDTGLSYDLKVSAGEEAPAAPWLDTYVAETTLTPTLLARGTSGKRIPTLLRNRYRFDLTGIAFPAELRISFDPRRTE